MQVTIFGEPIVDKILHLDRLPKLKDVQGKDVREGDRHLVDLQIITDLLKGQNLQPHFCGSAANVAKGLALLGTKVAYYGTCGNDKLGAQFHEALNALQIDVTIDKHPTEDTGQCLSLVTPGPDASSQRTLLTCLGAAATISDDDIHRYAETAFKKKGHVHIEGYSLYKENFAKTLIEYAITNEATVSLDLGSISCVHENKDAFIELIESGRVTVLVGNLAEMQELTGKQDAAKIAEDLGKHCTMVAVTLGKEGCCLKDESGETNYYPAYETTTTVIDTTGAGDFFTAGLVHCFLRNQHPGLSARIAAIMAAGTLTGDGADIHDWATTGELIDNAYIDWSST